MHIALVPLLPAEHKANNSSYFTSPISLIPCLYFSTVPTIPRNPSVTSMYKIHEFKRTI